MKEIQKNVTEYDCGKYEGTGEKYEENMKEYDGMCRK